MVRFTIAAVVLAGAVVSGQAPGAVAGQVVESGSNVPVSGARVQAMPLDWSCFKGCRSTANNKLTDESGRYTIEGLAPGHYRIDVQKPGSIIASRVVTIAGGQIADAATIAIQEGLAITGRVVAGAAEPASGITVMALRRGPTFGGLDRSLLSRMEG